MRAELADLRSGEMRLEITVPPDEIGVIAGVLNHLMQEVGHPELRRVWARLYWQFYGHRFIAGNFRFQWMDELVREGLVLEARTEEEAEALRVADLGGGAK